MPESTGRAVCVPYENERTELLLAGHSKAEVIAAIAAALDKKELPVLEPGAMCYMMSKEGYGGESVPHWPSHLMFFFSDIDPAIWGANLPGSPVIGMADPAEHLFRRIERDAADQQ